MSERGFWGRVRGIAREATEAAVAGLEFGLEAGEAVLETGRAATATAVRSAGAALDIAGDVVDSAADIVLDGADVEGTLGNLQEEVRDTLQETGQQVYDYWREAGLETQEAGEAALKAIRESGEALEAGAAALQDAYNELPPGVQIGLETALGFVPFYDGVSLLREGYNYLTGQGVDPVNVTLSTLGLAGDLGWLAPFTVDPLDGLNGGAAVLKAAYRQMDGPAKEVFGTLLRKVVTSGDEIGTAFANLGKRIGDLLPHAEALADNPNAVARLLNLKDEAFELATSSPDELTAAIRRSDFLDRFSGKSLPDPATPDGQDFARVYGQADANGVFRSAEPGYPDLRLREGELQEIVEAAPGLSPSRGPINQAIDATGNTIAEAGRRLSNSRLAELWENAPKNVKDGIERALANATLPLRDGFKVLKEFFKGVEDGKLNVAKAAISALKQGHKLGLFGDFKLFEDSAHSPADLDAGLDLLEDVYDRLPAGPAKDSLTDLLDRITDRDINAAKLAERLIDLEPHAEALRQNPEALVGILNLNEADFARATSSPEELNGAIQRVRAQATQSTPTVNPPGVRPVPAPGSSTTATTVRESARPTLGPGSTGPEVAAVQSFLYQEGYLPLDGIDGISGPQTEAAIKQFQRDNGLEANGIVGPQTRQALVEDILEAGDRPTLGRGDLGREVAALQSFLYQEGYLPLDGIDGLSGPQTEAAVKQFQQDNGLAVDGIVGPQTWQALVEGVQEREQSSDREAPTREATHKPAAEALQNVPRETPQQDPIRQPAVERPAAVAEPERAPHLADR